MKAARRAALLSRRPSRRLTTSTLSHAAGVVTINFNDAASKVGDEFYLYWTVPADIEVTMDDIYTLTPVDKARGYALYSFPETSGTFTLEAIQVRGALHSPISGPLAITLGATLVAPTLSGDASGVTVDLDATSEEGDVVQFYWTAPAVAGDPADDEYTLTAGDAASQTFSHAIDAAPGTYDLEAILKRGTSYSPVSNTLPITVEEPDIALLGSDQANGATITIPAHDAGDLILIAAYRNNLTPATIPGTFTSVFSGGSSGLSIAIGARVATSSSETSGTWTNATTLHVAVIKNASGAGAQQLRNAAASTSILWGGLTFNVADGSSWLFGFGMAASVVPGLPATQTNLQDTNGTVRCRTWHSNGGLSSHTQQTETVASQTYRTVVVEILKA